MVEKVPQIVVNPRDRKGMNALMEDAKAFPDKYNTMLIGENEQKERVFISVNPESICVETLQNNGWVRKNIYHYNHQYDDEEIYDGKWEELT